MLFTCLKKVRDTLVINCDDDVFWSGLGNRYLWSSPVPVRAQLRELEIFGLFLITAENIMYSAK